MVSYLSYIGIIHKAMEFQLAKRSSRSQMPLGLFFFFCLFVCLFVFCCGIQLRCIHAITIIAENQVECIISMRV